MTKTHSRRWQFNTQRERRLFMQPLESRALLAADTFVNDNWFVKTDADSSGTLTAGDLVDNRLDVTGKATAEGKFGTTAFDDIEAAISATDEGGTVTVLEGTYTGDVSVAKSVTLKGANAGISAGAEADADARGDETTIDGSITIQADDVTIDGLSISGGSDIGGDVAGIYLAGGAADATIRNNIITGDGAGRGILSTFNGENDNLLIENNEISGWTSGIFNQTNDNVDVVGNLIHDNVAGVANDFVDDLLIEGNNLKENDEAIGVNESTAVMVTGNDLADNAVAIANYAGDAVDAADNFFGTIDPDEIADLITGPGEVLTDNPLAESPFAVDEVADLVFTGDNGLMLTVNPETGDFEFTDGGDLTITGTGARVENGMLKIHTHDAQGRKVDIKGNVDGTIDVVLKQLGKGTKKQSYSLSAAEAEATA
jgi:hypothetical protein